MEGKKRSKQKNEKLMSFNDLLKLNGGLLSTLRGRRVGAPMYDPFFLLH